MTNQKYVTGRRFKAKIQGKPIEEMILSPCTLCGSWWDFNDKDGKQIICAGDLSDKMLNLLNITDLILLPDTEPQKGDAVEVSDDGQKWLNQGRTYTGFNYEGQFITMNRDNYFSGWKHIRLAKPIPTERELAEKKADEFLHWYKNNRNPTERSRADAVVEYILKTQKS